MIEFLLMLGVFALICGGFAYGYKQGLIRGSKITEEKYAKSAEEALKTCETAMAKLSERREEYNIAITAARQAYVSYMEEKGSPEDAQPPRVQ